MAKNFTKEELIMKHETNVKSATSSYALAGILGIIYIVRFLWVKNLNFYFSLSFNELMLRLFEAEKISDGICYTFIALFMLIYFIAIILAVKDSKGLTVCLGVYLFDCLCLLPLALVHSSVKPEFFIDVIVHLFVIMFLVVGMRSGKALKE